MTKATNKPIIHVSDRRPAPGAITAWHIPLAGGELRFNRDRMGLPVFAEAGKTYTAIMSDELPYMEESDLTGLRAPARLKSILPCRHGMHGSATFVNALSCAFGPALESCMLSRVKLWGEVSQKYIEPDICAARHRYVQEIAAVPGAALKIWGALMKIILWNLRCSTGQSRWLDPKFFDPDNRREQTMCQGPDIERTTMLVNLAHKGNVLNFLAATLPEPDEIQSGSASEREEPSLLIAGGSATLQISFRAIVRMLHADPTYFLTWQGAEFTLSILDHMMHYRIKDDDPAPELRDLEPYLSRILNAALKDKSEEE